MKNSLALALLCLLLPATAQATAQAGDMITYKGETSFMYANPLETYFNKEHPRPDDLFPSTCTACWRGYIGYWEIKDNQLWLVKLVAGGCSNNEPEIPLEKVLPGQKGPVAATWFSGTLVLPKGELLHYVHMGYQSVFETEVHIELKDGKVVKETTVDNTKMKFDENGNPVPAEPPKPPKPLEK